MTHEIKLKEQFRTPILNGEKTFEIRNNDRGYNRGDGLIMTIVDDHGREKKRLGKIHAKVGYVISGYGLKEGYVAFSLEDVREVE